MMIALRSFKEFKNHFKETDNPYLQFRFLEINNRKADDLLFFCNKPERPDLGLVLGVKNNELLSPFSAPFGGFYYRHESVYVSEIDVFLQALKNFFLQTSYSRLSITLPPDIYCSNMNAKLVNAFIRCGYQLNRYDITNQISLSAFKGFYQHRTAREYYQQAMRKGLSFNQVYDRESMAVCYDIVLNNRKRMGRPIHMKLEDLVEMEAIWPVDFFMVKNINQQAVAAAIFYRAHNTIVQAVLWGDSEEGRPARAMDFMILQLCKFYQQLGYKWIDLGISTEVNTPNEGLLRFKETHECTSSVRFAFSLENLKN